MPHSSGGGSHGGGSHSGGGRSHSSHSSRSSRSSSGSGGSINSNRISTKSFPGARRYVYYSGRRPHFVYSNYDIHKFDTRDFIVKIVAVLLFIVPLLSIPVLGVIAGRKVPKPLSTLSRYDNVIEDNLGVLEDVDDLSDTCQDFFDETGISVAVLTISNSEWQGKYSSLEQYAYDAYVERFKDESHWLIVYSSYPKHDGLDDSFDDWYWEGMQGDNTDSILTAKHADSFTQDLQKRLLQRGKYSVDDAIALSLEKLQPELMKTTYDLRIIALTIIVPLPFIWLVLYCIGFHPIVSMHRKKAVECSTKFVDQEKCEYCGGVYVAGFHKTCPHCSAELKEYRQE